MIRRAIAALGSGSELAAEDVRLALNGARPVEFMSRVGGNVPSTEDVLEFVQKQALRHLLTEAAEEGRFVHV